MIRSAYEPRERVQVVFPEDEVSRTKQQFKDECDINNILRKFQRTGAIEHVRKHGSSYGFAPAVDFHEAMNLVAQATEMYEDLPSSIRKDFAGPAEFLDFAQDPANVDAMVEYGLATKRKQRESLPAEPPPTSGDVTPGPASTPDPS